MDRLFRLYIIYGLCRRYFSRMDTFCFSTGQSIEGDLGSFFIWKIELAQSARRYSAGSVDLLPCFYGTYV